jgi:transmembrane sensor
LFLKIQDSISRENIEVPVKSIVRLWARIAAAAVVIIGLTFGSYYLMQQPPLPKANTVIVKNNVSPGANKATLTLSNGKQIILTGAQKGQLAVQGNIKIEKTADGQLVYQARGQDSSTNSTELAFNTMTTPRGGQFTVTLPDGSKVWLNAASSLTYPTVFNQKERRVKLQGEAYFEVAKNPEKPFHVIVNRGEEIEVLGTHFNIRAYADDQDIRTTLLEGSVKLIYKAKHIILKPGQMAINDLKESLLVQNADIEEVMGWKNGLFVYNNENIRDVLKSAARWYDIDVEYKDAVGQKKLWGTVSKYKSLAELLDNIAFTSGVHYKIEGRRVILFK